MFWWSIHDQAQVLSIIIPLLHVHVNITINPDDNALIKVFSAAEYHHSCTTEIVSVFVLLLQI